MRRVIGLKTCNHLGDTLCLTAAAYNLKQILPDVGFTYSGNYADVFLGTDLLCNERATEWHDVRYRDFKTKDNNAPTGNLCEGITASFARHLGMKIPCSVKVPQIAVTEDSGKCVQDFGLEGRDYVICNTNCQDNSTVKMYPWWSEVFNRCRDIAFALIGGREARDRRTILSGQFSNVVDLREKTSIRQLMMLVKESLGVVSPPSAVIHIGAGLGKRMVCITGARESVKLTEYPNCEHLHNVCYGRMTYSRDFGCMHFKTQDPRSCEHSVDVNGVRYARCMMDISPETVADAIGRMIHPEIL